MPNHTKKQVSASKNNFAIESQFNPIILNTEKKMYTNEKTKKWKKRWMPGYLGPSTNRFSVDLVLARGLTSRHVTLVIPGPVPVKVIVDPVNLYRKSSY